MKQRSTLRVVTIGVAILALSNLLYVLVLLNVRFDDEIRLLALILPGLSGFVVALVARKRKFALGVSMAPIGAAISTLSGYVYRWMGFQLDHIAGPVGMFLLTLGYQLIVCSLGSACGYLLSSVLHRTADRKAPMTSKK